MAFNCLEQTVGKGRARLLVPQGLPEGCVVISAGLDGEVFLERKKISANLSKEALDLGAEPQPFALLCGQGHRPCWAPQANNEVTKQLPTQRLCQHKPSSPQEGGSRPAFWHLGNLGSIPGRQTLSKINRGVKRPETSHRAERTPGLWGDPAWSRVHPRAASPHQTLSPASQQRHLAVPLTLRTERDSERGEVAEAGKTPNSAAPTEVSEKWVP